MSNETRNAMPDPVDESFSARRLLGLHGVRSLPWNTLRTRITLLALVTVLVGIWAMMLYVSSVLREDSQRLLSEQQYSVAKLLAGTIEHEVSFRLDALADVANEAAAAMASGPAAMQTLLVGHHHHLTALFNGGVLIIGADGKAIADTTAEVNRIGVSYRHIDSVAAALDEGKATVGRPVVGEKLGKPVIGMSVPIRDRQGRIVGALAGVTNLATPNYLDVFSRNAYAWDGGYLLLVAPKHRLIVTSSDKRRAMEELPPKGANPGIDRYIDGAEGYSIIINPTGMEVLAAIKRVPNADWYVAVVLPTSTVFAPIRAMEHRFLLAAILLSLLVGGATWLLLRRQLRPMLTAANALATLTLKKEQVPQPLPVDRQDEVGDLIGGFNRLLALLAEREEHLHMFAHIVDQSPESILITGIDRRINYVNATCCAITGYSPGELIGQTPRLLHSGKTPQATYASMWRELTQGRAWKGEFINRRKDGGEFIEYAWIMPLRQLDGRISHYVAMKEDITERKRIGAELDAHRFHLEELVAMRTRQLDTARKAAETAAEAKSCFLASMSHEIRTPMNAIIGLTRMAERMAVDTQQRDHLHKVALASQHLLRIINDILDLSKIEAGKLQIVAAEFSLQDCFEAALTMVRTQAEAKGLWLSSSVDPALAGCLIGDGLRIEQILINLVGNALKFTDHGGIALHAVLAGEDQTGLLLRCEVVDSGIGIPADQLPRLFHDYEQAEASTTRRFGGTGLGLSICRHLAELMGGAVGVQSTPGQGSVFWFTVRLKRGQRQCLAEAERVSSEADVIAQLREHHGRARLLVVEDEPINRIITIEMLKEVWPSVDVACDGAEAVQRVREHGCDLVLMDLQMPVLDGLEATRQIRQLVHGSDVPIVGLTASATAEDKADCFAAGMNDFTTKPIDPSELFGVILKWLSR